ncbi:MAG: nicotinate-nucleotide adenylyltransferase [Kiloniellaceae bacterium]
MPGPGQRIGLLGGSFNPAHRGHLDISREALRRLRLDRVWWLVSPQNPLKPKGQTAPLERRLAGARALADDPRIVVTPVEAALGAVYTADTLAALAARFPRVRFVWLMGADNLIQIAAWKDWQEIFNTLPVAVFDRPSYSLEALAAKAARRFARHRRPESWARHLAGERPPAWVFIHQRLNPQSSTGIRAAARTRGRPPRDRAPGRRRTIGNGENTP